MRNLLRYLGDGNREQDETGPKDITPADRVRLAHEKLERAPTGTIESIPVDRDGICESCGRPLKPDSRILGIEHCPTCDGPFSRRVLMRWLMAAFWGAAWAFGLSVGFILKNLFMDGYIPDIPGFWMFPLFWWPLITLGIALQKILPGGVYSVGGGGRGFSGIGGSNGGGGASGG